MIEDIKNTDFNVLVRDKRIDEYTLKRLLKASNLLQDLIFDKKFCKEEIIDILEGETGFGALRDSEEAIAISYREMRHKKAEDTILGWGKAIRERMRK